MIDFRQREYVRHLPNVQMIPLIDILFVTLSFFMAMFLHFNFEAKLGIAVPQAASSAEAQVAPEELVINISKDGDIFIGQKKLDLASLGTLLKKTVQLYPSQAVIVRADQKTYHENVVQVLDVCAKANIWNISFATTREG